MPTIGNIEIPAVEITATRWPVRPEYPSGRAHKPVIVEHRLGPNSANGKITQRYVMCNGAKEFTVVTKHLTWQRRQALLDFWHENRGAYGSFYYDCPNEDGTSTEYLCRLKDQELTLEFLYGCISSVGVTLVEIPTSNPEYTVASETTRLGADRLLSDALETALTEQVQVIIPLIRIQAKDEDYPTIYLSDRRCVVGGDQYEPRLLDWDGIEQSMDGASDQASFTFGNADKVFTQLVNGVDLFRADIQFSLYHVGSQIKLNLWRGNLTNWKTGAVSDVMNVTASDGFYELNQMYPRRKISRTCWKKFNDGLNCPFEAESNQVAEERSLPQSDGTSKLYVFQPDASKCDKSWDGPNGCLAHFMESRFGGIVAKPQGVRTKDNSTGHWGFGRSPMTSTSLIADSIYGQVIPEIYVKIANEDISVGFPVNAKLAAGRDEGDFYCALGIVGEGPITEFASPRPYPILVDGGTVVATTAQQAAYALAVLALMDLASKRDSESDIRTAFSVALGRPLKDTERVVLPFNPHKLDGQDHHGYASDQKNNYGLRLGNITGHMGTHGFDPVPTGEGNNFSLGEGGAGITRWGPERAAGTAFAEIRRKDEKGLQLSRLEEHSMQIAIRQGLKMWTWTEEGDGTFTRSEEMTVTPNPIWIAVNVILRAKGLLFAESDAQLEVFDGRSACICASICEEQVDKLIGTGKEEQFRFTGILQEWKSTREWLGEILNTCLGYFTTSFGRIKFGIRANSSAVEQFSDGNMVWGSLECEPLKPEFWKLIGHFADEEFAYVANNVDIYDESYTELMGETVALPKEMNFLGSPSKSQTARLVTTRLREETGGWRPAVQKVARRGRYKTTLLGLSVEPGMVCRLDHEDLPTYPATIEGSIDPEEERPNHIQLRVLSWRLSKDYSIDVEFRSLHNEIYDLVAGPKPADVELIPLPREETFKPANWRFYARTERDGLLRLHRIAVGTHKETVHRGTFEVYSCNEATNFYGTIVGSATETQTSFTMSGHPPIDGRWIMVDSEIMFVEEYEATDSNFGTVTVQRGQLGTQPAAHERIECTIQEIDEDNPCHLVVDMDLGLRPGSRVVVNDGGGPPFDQQPIASYNPATGDLYTTLPLTTADVGEQLYSDPRLWIIDLHREEVPFQPRFFSSANRAKWEHAINLRNAGVVLVRGKLYNTRGIASDYVYCFPASSDEMEPATELAMARSDFATPWPHRVRTLDGHAFQMPYKDLPTGVTVGLFQSIKAAESQPFEGAYAEVTGGVANALATPPTVSASVATELRPSGSIVIGGEVTEDSLIEVRITGDNEIQVPVWIARDHEDVTNVTQAATSLTNWLNGDPAFTQFYSAGYELISEEQAEGSPLEYDGVVITALGPEAGIIETDVAGGITATPSGFESKLGILTGRKYAVSFRGAGLTSALSPLSASTGPTGAAERIEIKDVPVSADERVTDVDIWATPDGREEPFFLVATAGNGAAALTDTIHEDALALQAEYTGAVQPEMDGPVIVTLRKNGEDWCKLFIPSDQARSNTVHGFALVPIQTGSEITVEVDNQAEVLDLATYLL